MKREPHKRPPVRKLANRPNPTSLPLSVTASQQLEAELRLAISFLNDRCAALEAENRRIRAHIFLVTGKAVPS